MLQLLYNELYKIFHNKRIYIFLGIIAAFTILTAVLINFMPETQYNTAEMLNSVKGPYYPREVYNIMSDVLFPIFVILIVIFLVAEEYENGTLKLPLIHGFSRQEVIASKIICSIIVTIFMLVSTYAMTYIISQILWKNAFSDIPYTLLTLKRGCLSIFPLIGIIVCSTYIVFFYLLIYFIFKRIEIQK